MAIATEHNKRFSLTAYSNVLKTNHNAGKQAPSPFATEEDLHNDFGKLVDEIRSFLVAAKGKTEEERIQYNESLNRAVLGYTEDRERLLAVIQDQLIKRRAHDAPPQNRKYSTMAEAIFAEVIGLNVLELIFKNRQGLEEVQVIGTQIYEVRGGTPELSIYRFESVKDVERIQQNLVLFNSDTLNPRKRWAEVMLSDGSRVTLTGFGFTAEPTMTIRFYVVNHFRLNTLCRPEYETMDETMKEIILTVIRSYFNMVVIGPTNSGKTNLIKAMIAEMPDQERIVTIESRFELMLRKDFPGKNIIEYEVDDEDEHHSGRQAFKLALRQSPKRICHAEIRDEDANIYVRACTRGHEGSITSVHVNRLEDVPDAITDMCMLDGRGMNPERLTKRITRYVTQIGFEMATVDGKRKMTRIGEFGFEAGEVVVRDIAVYNFKMKRWDYKETFSAQASLRMLKHDEAGYERLLSLGLVKKCI